MNDAIIPNEYRSIFTGHLTPTTVVDSAGAALGTFFPYQPGRRDDGDRAWVEFKQQIENRQGRDQ
jgi:hypothetical protein